MSRSKKIIDKTKSKFKKIKENRKDIKKIIKGSNKTLLDKFKSIALKIKDFILDLWLLFLILFIVILIVKYFSSKSNIDLSSRIAIYSLITFVLTCYLGFQEELKVGEAMFTCLPLLGLLIIVDIMTTILLDSIKGPHIQLDTLIGLIILGSIAFILLYKTLDLIDFILDK